MFSLIYIESFEVETSPLSTGFQMKSIMFPQESNWKRKPVICIYELDGASGDTTSRSDAQPAGLEGTRFYTGLFSIFM